MTMFELRLPTPDTHAAARRAALRRLMGLPGRAAAGSDVEVKAAEVRGPSWLEGFASGFSAAAERMRTDELERWCAQVSDPSFTVDYLIDRYELDLHLGVGYSHRAVRMIGTAPWVMVKGESLVEVLDQAEAEAAARAERAARPVTDQAAHTTEGDPA